MKDPTRYEPEVMGDDTLGDARMTEHSQGDWVSYESYRELQDELDALRDRIGDSLAILNQALSDKPTWIR